ncbi:sensor histidine kinase [Pelagicoccus sp. SDUM812002]|uniref:sensor histidine kinase n=1 Tax=Pelagicoccus sp. SDUM812002 TaxID=3041266 RepID=UPI0028102976|nr:sensor histidine kinase [Pelagicoccus sp. SDUM812002]MDQ8185800.1 sensor histidine kinase [Pelagicoccus sp. SDUM812002]
MKPTHNRPNGDPGLAAYLRSNKRAIIDGWQERANGEETLSVTRSLSRAEFIDGIPQVIDQLTRVFEAGELLENDSELQDSISHHGHERWKQGFELKELVVDWGLLQEVATEFVSDYLDQCPSTSAHFALGIVVKFFTRSLCVSVSRYDQLRQVEASSVSRDIERAKEKLEKVRTEQATLIRQISHDMRGELATIKGASNILELERGDQSADDLGSVISNSVSSVTEFLDSLLDLSRLDSGAEERHIRKIDAAAFLESLAAGYGPVAKEKGLEFKASGEGPLEIETDPKKLKRIVQNLTINALKYTTDGSVEIAWKSRSDGWALSITDTGPGLRSEEGTPILRQMNLPEEDLDHSQNAMKRGSMDYEGEGIGLAIVKRLCELLDISISMSSQPDNGTTFELVLPKTYPTK